MAREFGFSPEEKLPCFFISYNSPDVERIAKICMELNTRGVSMWYDKGLFPGDEWEKQIALRINKCYQVIIFVTKNLMRRRDAYVVKEYRFARAFHKKINIVMLDDVSRNDVCDAMKSWYDEITDSDDHRITPLPNASPAQVADNLNSVTALLPDVIKKFKQKQKRKALSLSAIAAFVILLGALAGKNLYDKFYANYIYDDGQFNYVIHWEGVEITGVTNSSANVIELPDEIKGRPVIKIADSAFENRSDLQEIRISDTVTEIGKNAFRKCTSLSIVHLSDNLITIDKGAFSECSSLSEIILPANLETISEAAFYHCVCLKAIIFPDHLKTIGYGAFSGCTDLTSISIPDSVVTVEGYAFNNCKSLEDLKLSNSLDEINWFTFSDCENLKKIDIPNTVVNIGVGAFYGCTNLQELNLADSLEIIDNGAFYHCDHLTVVSIPTSVKEIRSYAFSFCSSLEKIDIPDSVVKIGDFTFCGCNGLKNIRIPKSVGEFGEYIFLDCTNLRDITVSSESNYFHISNGVIFDKTQHSIIYYPPYKKEKLFIMPDTVTDVKDGAFENNNYLEEVVFSNSVKTIGRYAFAGCNNLITANMPESVELIGYDAFSGCNSLQSVIPDLYDEGDCMDREQYMDPPYYSYGIELYN